MNTAPIKSPEQYRGINLDHKRFTSLVRAVNRLAECNKAFEGLMIDRRTCRSLFAASKAIYKLQNEVTKAAPAILNLKLELPKLLGGISKYLSEENSKAAFLRGKGLVPHKDLWMQLFLLRDSSVQITEKSSVELASLVWPFLKKDIVPAKIVSLGDEILYRTYLQMICNHSSGNYEIVRCAFITILERCAQLFSEPQKNYRPQDWLEKDVSKLTPAVIGGWLNYELYKAIKFESLKSCYDDNQMDQLKYANRHAIGHGRGSRPATVVDSLNVILMSNFCIEVAIILLNRNTEALLN